MKIYNHNRYWLKNPWPRKREYEKKVREIAWCYVICALSWASFSPGSGESSVFSHPWLYDYYYHSSAPHSDRRHADHHNLLPGSAIVSHYRSAGWCDDISAAELMITARHRWRSEKSFCRAGNPIPGVRIWFQNIHTWKYATKGNGAHKHC